MSLFTVFPAIDLKNGQCVRLKKGNMEQATVFHNEPAKQAALFEEAGCKWLHVVDLDGAFEGKSINHTAIEAILKKTDLSVQLGGGIRTLKNIEDWLAMGVKRIILGTAAIEQPTLLKEATQLFPNQILVGIDCHFEKVASHGWSKTSQLGLQTFAKSLEDIGVTAIIYTDIDRDGILTGPNFESSKRLANSVSIPVIISGGVKNTDDIRKARSLQKEGITGIIVGRAYYEGHISPKELTSC